MMAAVTHVTYQSMEQYVVLYYFMDSMIALCWVHNKHRRLKTFVQNWVVTIRRQLRWTDREDEIPLYHIAGTRNIADLLTKQHEFSIDLIKRNSEWQ